MAKKKSTEKETEQSQPNTKEEFQMSNENPENLGFGPNASDEEGEFFAPDFSDTYEEIALPDGTQALLRLRSVDQKNDKNGNPYKRLSYEPVEEPYAKMITFFLFLPAVSDDPRVRNRKNLALQKWMKCHGVEGRFNWNDLIGNEVWAILRKTESEQYGEQNEVKEWIRQA